MSIVRLIWLMGSRGVLFAALAAVILHYATTVFLDPSMGTTPPFSWPCTFLGCYAPRFGTYNFLLEPPFMWLLVLIPFAFMFGARRGLLKWRATPPAAA